MATVDTASQGRLPWHGHLAATLKLGLPLVGAQLAQMAMGVTDTVMIGWLGARELAASVLGTQGIFLATMLGSGFAFALMPMVAQASGADNVRQARRATRMGLWIVILYSAIMMLPLWHYEAILIGLGQEPDIAAMSNDYMQIIVWSLAPALMVFVLRSFLSALEHARVVLVATIISAVFNAFLNYALIFGNWGAPEMGLRGAAVATLASSILAVVLLLIYSTVVPAIRRYELLVRFWRPDWPAFLEVLQLGWPISLTIIAEVGLFAAASIMMGWIGPIQLAAHGIAIQIAAVAFMIPLGLSTAGTIRIGRAFGARDYPDLPGIGTSTFAAALAAASLSALCFLLIPTVLIGLFLDPTNPDAGAVMLAAVPILAVGAAFQLVDGAQAVAVGLLRGLKDMRMSMIIAVISYWIVGIPMAYILGFVADWGGVGIWSGLGIGLFTAALLLTLRFVSKLRTMVHEAA